MSRNAVEFDKTGKVVLDHIYNKPDPRLYYSTLNTLDYSIPGEAAPVFRRVIAARRAEAEDPAIGIVDLGCSYGVNAAILKHGLDMGDLYDRYTGDKAAQMPREKLIAHDRDFYADHLADPMLEVTGIDIAERAVDYAVETRMLDSGIAVNLETDALPAEAAGPVGASDIVISTGCIGYVKEESLRKILDTSNGNAPWMAHFVLRMFPYESFEDMFAELGYVTEKLPGTFRQRRFVSAEEQQNAVDNLSGLGIDPTGLESEGWYHAEFHLSRPAAAASALPLSEFISQ